MKSLNSLDLPVRPHVYKYLLLHLGPEYVLSRTDPHGLLLFLLLRSPLTNARKDAVVAEYSLKFNVGLENYPFRQYGLTLTSDTVYMFNNTVHEQIKAELHAFVDLAVELGQRQKDAVLDFMAKYDFTDKDISYDTLIKSYQRYRASVPTKKRKVVTVNLRKDMLNLQASLSQLVVSTATAGHAVRV
ncbi:hypothetical protein GCM10027346_20930 [Hymenobacter seoulensis]